jgi:hypothetical protein
MSGKSIKEILEKIENERIEKIKKNEEEERRLNSIREKSRREYLERNRIYENALYNTTTNTSSAGGRVSKEKTKVKSYIANDTSYLYPIIDLEDTISSNPSLYVERVENILTFTDVQQLYDFYDAVYFKTTISNALNGSNGYDVAVGTQLKDLGSTFKMILLDDRKIVEWRLVKQLTPQSELDPRGYSPDGTEGYVTIYSDWDENGLIDPNDRGYILSVTTGLDVNIDLATLDDGPLVDFDE